MRGIRLPVVWAVLAAVLILASAAAQQPPVLTILHFNDDYQLTAVDNGRAGGPLMVTVVIEAIQRARVINPRLEGRITIVR